RGHRPRTGHLDLLARSRECHRLLGALVQQRTPPFLDRRHPTTRVRAEPLRFSTGPRRTRRGLTKPSTGSRPVHTSGRASRAWSKATLTCPDSTHWWGVPAWVVITRPRGGARRSADSGTGPSD